VPVVKPWLSIFGIAQVMLLHEVHAASAAGRVRLMERFAGAGSRESR
jgi:hypothetical protein